LMERRPERVAGNKRVGETDDVTGYATNGCLARRLRRCAARCRSVNVSSLVHQRFRVHPAERVTAQDRFGLTAEWSQFSYVTDLSAGPDTYFAKLLARDRGLVRDTERCQRKAERTYGPLGPVIN
jgi:hypothetical protein